MDTKINPLFMERISVYAKKVALRKVTHTGFTSSGWRLDNKLLVAAE